ncbi:precorrin-6y C5,15-methyltransferase (decarboxylating) subunit CbiE [Fusobacterium sp.]|uniref:precorrin-6y C5,15-methyltransferase (decarboxylating) subunit CbiE n=1 Tax=Fusobacterium sp. TaxID=68766 RepID=UPI0025C1D4F6|nr:precorrin-6y C5,15-methyltransferase (decarboxylating) subunit CbiE [Fusobacterium sp.]
MEKIRVVGLGPGNIDYITKKGIDTIRSSEIAVGGARQLMEISSLLPADCYKYTLEKLSDLIIYLNQNRDKKITIIVSGDTGFYSLLSFLRRNYKNEELEVIPGISSYQYLFSRIGEVWQEYKLLSVHGREADYIEEFTKEKGIVLLTDNINTPYAIAKKFYENGFADAEMVIGERLSYSDEKITILKIAEYESLNREFLMNIVIIRK